MSFSYRLYSEFRLLFEICCEMFCNALRFTPLGPKRFTNYPDNIKGKVVIITGANSGIGKVTATVMARLGAKVLMACRDIPKAKAAADEISNEVKSADIEVMKLDLSSLESVREFAKEVIGKVSKIDLLINNAGVMITPKWSTADGFEMQFGTNHLGHFLLTLLLMEKLKNAPNARVVNVSSVAHIKGYINFEDINLNKNYNKYMAYSQSKLANILFTRELANRLSDTNINTYALHPGLINTDLYRHLSGVQAFLYKLFQKISQIDVELGTQTTLYCALEESLSNETGRYYKNCGRVDRMVANAVDDVSARKLWDLSCELVDIEDKYKL